MSDQAARARIVDHCSAEGAWRMAFLAPAPALAPYVTRFTAYRERDTRFVRRRELPSGLATLVFNLGEELRVEYPAETSTAYGAGDAFYTGLSDAYAVTETDRAQEGAQIMLTPLGARRLVGFPLAEVGDQLIDPADLFGAEAREATERLQEANSQEQRLAILEAMATQQAAARRRRGPAGRSAMGAPAPPGQRGTPAHLGARGRNRLQPQALERALRARVRHGPEGLRAGAALPPSGRRPARPRRGGLGGAGRPLRLCRPGASDARFYRLRRRAARRVPAPRACRTRAVSSTDQRLAAR